MDRSATQTLNCISRADIDERFVLLLEAIAQSPGRAVPELIEDLRRTGSATAFQLRYLAAGRGEELLFGCYLIEQSICSDLRVHRFRARRITDASAAELFVFECDEESQADRISDQLSDLAARGRKWLDRHGRATEDSVAPVVESGRTGQRVFAVAPWSEGTSVREVMIGRGRCDASTVVAIARPLLRLAAELEDARIACDGVTADDVRFTTQGKLTIVAPGVYSAFDANVDRAAVALGRLLQKLWLGRLSDAVEVKRQFLARCEQELAAVIRALHNPRRTESLQSIINRLPPVSIEMQLVASRTIKRSIDPGQQWLAGRYAPCHSALEIGQLMRRHSWAIAAVFLVLIGWTFAKWKSLDYSSCSGPTGHVFQHALNQQRRSSNDSVIVAAAIMKDDQPRSSAAVDLSTDDRANDEMTEIKLRAHGSQRGLSECQEGGENANTESRVRASQSGVVQAVRLSVSPPANQKDLLVGTDARLRDKQPTTGRPVDLIIDSSVPIPADSLSLENGLCIRARPGRRATILLPAIGWKLTANDLVFENIDFLVACERAVGSTNDAPLIVLRAARAEFRNCAFSGQGRTAILWSCGTDHSREDVPVGRIRLTDSLFIECRAVVDGCLRSVSIVEASNVLVWRCDAMWQVRCESAFTDVMRLLLSHATLRESGALIEFADGSGVPAEWFVQSRSTVIVPRSGRPVILLRSDHPDRVIERLRWSGEGSVLSEDTPLVSVVREGTESVPLDDSGLVVAGLTRGQPEFNGPADGTMEDQKLNRWIGPTLGEEAPGVIVSRLPAIPGNRYNTGSGS